MDIDVYKEYQSELDMLDKFDSDFNNDLITKIVIVELQRCNKIGHVKLTNNIKNQKTKKVIS